jgi:hypothetical protein
VRLRSLTSNFWGKEIIKLSELKGDNFVMVAQTKNYCYPDCKKYETKNCPFPGMITKIDWCSLGEP